MSTLLDDLRGYADEFDTTSESLMLLGNAGLGKTHAALAIAGEVLEKGFDVIYVSSPDFFSKLEALHFGSDPAGEEEMLLRTAAGADLLILDDLGSEFNSSFLISTLYSLLNNRLGAKLPTIVTTNITDGALLEKLYTEKISSRLSSLSPSSLWATIFGRRRQKKRKQDRSQREFLFRKGISNMGIVVIGAVFVDIKGYPLSTYIPGGRNAGRIEQVHGGVSRNVAEDIANVELRPTFVGLVDDTGMGQDVIDKLDNHKVNTRYIQKVPDGMGTWLAIFDNDGDVHAAISKRPDTTPLTTLLEEKGDEIFKDCDAIAIELDLEKDTVKQVLRYARKYNKKVFAAVSNMSIAMERRDYLQQIDCFVCNQQEAGLLFSDDYEHLAPSQMAQVLARNVHSANMPSMVVTMGGQGAVYAKHTGECGVVPAKKVDVIDTTGAGDAFFAGTVIGLTYGKNLAQSCEIGSRLAASVICITENVCPRFRPLEFGLDVPVVD